MNKIEFEVLSVVLKNSTSEIETQEGKMSNSDAEKFKERGFDIQLTKTLITIHITQKNERRFGDTSTPPITLL